MSTTRPLFDAPIVQRAIVDSFKKLDPRRQARNPVMFVVFVGAAFTTVPLIAALLGHGDGRAGFVANISAWLWFTLLFANFAETMAEGRGKVQADALKKTRRDVNAKRIKEFKNRVDFELVLAPMLRKGDLVVVDAGEVIPCDGTVVDGVASVDESAITGESAPVIRESGGDRDAVTGGTRVLSDWLVVQASADPGESFLDRMITLVEGAHRKKTPNEIALDILLAALTLVFLVALLVCLIPTTIGALLSAIGIAGMDRMIQANVIATSGRAVETAGDVDVLLLDKTGTITLGNRQAVAFVAADGVTEEALADAAQLSSLADETPEGRSIVILAKERFQIRERNVHDLGATFVPFTAQTRMSGVDYGGRSIRKGAADTIAKWLVLELNLALDAR